MLKSKSITFTYDGKNELVFPDINLKKAESLLVLGNSGVGKTTFIQILAGLLIPKSGEIELNGNRYKNLSIKELDLFRGRQIGMIFQQPYFVQTLTILENLLLTLYLSKSNKNKDLAIHILKDIGLFNKIHSYPSELSQGEQQRAAIALAVVKKPDLILADEPTSSLDDDNCKKTIKILKEQANLFQSKLIIITHDSRLKKEFKKSITL
tara:strand:+ start:702 stop:1328 length:627 start_codon:yes stop_codon:yes gene_type:complete